MTNSRIVLPGSHKHAAAFADRIGPADPSEQAHVTVIVRRKDEPMPITGYGARMSTEQYTSAHGASASDFLSVREFARQYNLGPRNENAATRSIELHGSVGDLSRAFGVSLDHVKINDQIHPVRQGDITIPEELAGKTIAVLGRDNRPVAKPHFQRMELGGAPAAAR